MEELQKRVESIKSKLNKDAVPLANGESESLKKVAELRQTVDELTEENAALTMKVKEYSWKVESLNKQISELTKTQAAATEEVKKEAGSEILKEFNERLEKAVKEKEDANKKVEEMQKEQEVLNTKLLAITKERDECLQELGKEKQASVQSEELGKKTEEANMKVAELSKIIEELNKEKELKDKSLQDIQASLKETQESLEKLKTEGTALRSKVLKFINALKGAIKVTGEFTEASNVIKALVVDLKKYWEDINSVIVGKVGEYLESVQSKEAVYEMM